MKKKHQEQPAPPAAANTDNSSGNRNIFLFGRLENEVVLPVIKRLMKLNEQDGNKPINLFINSAGGNGYNADAIIAVMHGLTATVNTICLGHALSGACEILASGTGVRSSYEFATLMFHQTLWEADGDITNLEIQAAQGQRFREAQVELLHRCTGQDKDRIRHDIERDHYMSAEDAVKYGIIDKVLPHDRELEFSRRTAGSKRVAASSQLRVLKETAKSGTKAAAKSARKLSTRSKGARPRKTR